MFAERLVRARKAAGLSMKALAEQVGVSANAIKKYEHGVNMPSSTNLLALAKALEVRTEYFFRSVKVELERVEYRKRANTSKKLLGQINGDVMDQAERWAELLDIYPDSIKPVPTFALPDCLPELIATPTEIEIVADVMRGKWALGLNPIPNMVDILESKGVMIISTSVEAKKKFDGLAGNIGNTPVVVVSTHQPGDRQRFTLAHELGHLVLHDRLPESMDEEKACNHFAGAFLFPKYALIQRMGANRQAIESQELYMLKHEFGISMMAVFMRAEQCGVISESLKKQYFMRFSQLGWRTKEPWKAYRNEDTYLFTQLVYRALAEEYIGESKAAELIGTSLSVFHKERKLGVIGATVNQ